MLMQNLIEYSDSYSKISWGLWQCYRDEQNVILTDSKSFKSKIKLENPLMMVMQKMLK